MAGLVPGRAAKPAELKLIEGNRGHRPLNFGPKFKSNNMPRPPQELGEDGKKLWRKIKRHLEGAGIAGAQFAEILALCCQAHQNIIDAEAEIKAKGMTFTTSTGYVAPRPEVKMRDTAMRLKAKFLAEMGLTQSAKGRIIIPKVNPAKTRSLRDELEDDE